MSCGGTLLGVLLLLAGGEAATSAEEHPLMPILRFASDRYQQFGLEVQDYTCTLVKHERVRGRVLEPETISLKVRQEQTRNSRVAVPFSAYLHFASPADIQDREVIYVRGRHDEKIIVRNGGRRFGYITTSITIDGDLAMQRDRYPITEIGIHNLIKRLIEVGTDDLEHDECEVKYYTDAKINGRKCTVMEIIHPERREYFTYHIARIYVDDESQYPVRYAAWEWPDEEGGKPRLIEEYTYIDVKFNVGLTDRDFDHRNPDYGFRQSFKP